MPSTREGQLAMCGGWLSFLTPERRAAWGIPEEPFAELAALHGAAEALLPEAVNRAERNHVITVETWGAFRAIKAAMRSFRSRFFTLPPLDAAAWAALGFRAKRRRKGKIPPPAMTLGYAGGGVLVARPGP
jgi:hypothetical protein